MQDWVALAIGTPELFMTLVIMVVALVENTWNVKSVRRTMYPPKIKGSALPVQARGVLVHPRTFGWKETLMGSCKTKPSVSNVLQVQNHL